MQFRANPFRTNPNAFAMDETLPDLSVDSAAPRRLLEVCPAHKQTPLFNQTDLAQQAGIEALYIKDERTRMGLGSFKALGAAYVIAHDAKMTGAEDLRNALAGETYVTASAGNHGLSMASGAPIFGAKAVVYIAETVPEAFADRLRAKDARVVREGATYEDSMAAAARAAAMEKWHLLSDSSWPGYTVRPHRLMEGYLVLMEEVMAQIPETPTHILLQAGVGGLAGACARMARHCWGDAPIIHVVEPDRAPALEVSVANGAFTEAEGTVSDMGRLDCKEASFIALQSLVRDADGYALISDDEAWDCVTQLAELDIATTPSGAAGIAALLADRKNALGTRPESRVLAILSEGPEA